MASDNRTEAATPRKRAEARQKGQVAKSVEMSSVAVLFGGLIVLSNKSGDLMAQYTSIARAAFSQIAISHEEPEAIMSLAGNLYSSGLLALAPLVMATAIAGISVNLAQVGPMLSATPLKPNFSRINPITGIKRLWSSRVFFELFKASIKAFVMAFIAYQVTKEKFWVLVGLQTTTPEGTLSGLGGIILEIGQKCGLALLIMALADYAYQRRTHEESLKMSKEEIKEEFRQGEGDPHIKSKLRQLQRRYATGRMMASVPHADVVVTNPTHYAVALEYKPPKMQAPVVTAKGQMLVAEQIKRIAREHDVPIVENPLLARALHASVEIGSAVPPALYQAVAEVLAFIYRLREEKRAASQQITRWGDGMDKRETPWL